MSEERERILRHGEARLDGRCLHCSIYEPLWPTNYCAACWSHDRVEVRGRDVLTLVLPKDRGNVTFKYVPVDDWEPPEVITLWSDDGLYKQEIRIHTEKKT